MKARRAIAALCILLIGVGVFTDLTWRKRKQERALRDEEIAADRFIDAGVILHTVAADPAGTELIRGKPKLRVLRKRSFGGVIDTRARPPRIIGPSQAPVSWFCSEDQEAVLLHQGPELGQLVYGSEGGGKTTVLAMWHYLRWLEHLGRRGAEGLQTAPTLKRLGLVRREICNLWPSDWYRYVARKDFEGFELCDGTAIRMVSTHRQSESQGSPIQGFNSWWAGRDEGQDQIEVHEDIESRGRAAPEVEGVAQFKQLITATAKSNPAWRTLRQMLVASGQWIRRTLLIGRSPFVSPTFLEQRKHVMSEREFRRRYLAEDLLPELAVYTSWDRDKNTIRISESWEDVTAAELARWGGHFGMLGGHDPGSLFDVTLMLRAYRRPRAERPIWVVVDELTTERSTTEQHVKLLLERARARWRLNLLDPRGRPSADGPRLYLRADPYGNTDNKVDATCYTIFRNAGFAIDPAAYSKTGTGPGRIPKEAGIELVNTLLCSATGERRLFVALDELGRPVAPRLVEALETSERDADGRAETQKKNRKDVSHWCAALRYALWAIERPRLGVVP